MKNLVTITALLIFTTFCRAGDLDSLRRQLKDISNDSLKAPVYAQIAAEYMQFDTITSRVKKMVYQNESLINLYQALHIYTKYTDTTGMRTCFYNLSHVYHRLQKYSQAKWFILQANHLARIQRDAPYIALTLRKLAAIKTDLKEYKLAEADLKEAKQLTATGIAQPYNPYGSEESKPVAEKAKSPEKKKNNQLAPAKPAKQIIISNSIFSKKIEAPLTLAFVQPAQ